MDPYEILGLSSRDSEKKIKERYRFLMKKYHPDLNLGNEAAAELSRIYVQAYREIIDGEEEDEAVETFFRDVARAAAESRRQDIEKMSIRIRMVLPGEYPNFRGIEAIKQKMKEARIPGTPWIGSSVKETLEEMVKMGEIEYVRHKGYRMKRERE